MEPELTVDLAIVGAGPAGMAAAELAASFGLDTCLLDVFPQPGGQYGKQLPEEYGAGEVQVPPAGVRWLRASTVWSIAPGFSLRVAGPHGVRHICAQQVILAPGAHDRPVPFPGWTLPGVLMAGAAQTMLKGQGILPGKRVLLDGTGPLQFALAHQLTEAGAQVVAICDSNRASLAWVGLLGALWGQWARLGEAITYFRTIWKHHIPWLRGHTVFAAQGREAVESAVIGRIDCQGTPIPGSERTVEVDAICLGFGFLPNRQLAQVAGVRFAWDAKGEQDFPETSDRMETSSPGLYVAGDGAVVRGSQAAVLQGRLAALAAAQRAGRIDKATGERRARPWLSALARERRFAAALERAYPFLPRLWDLVQDDTVICRCEEVRAGEIKAAIAAGAVTADAVKRRTRAGMGRCQGRMCRQSIEHLIAASAGTHPAAHGLGRVRPPVLPIPLGELATRERRR